MILNTLGSAAFGYIKTSIVSAPLFGLVE